MEAYFRVFVNLESNKWAKLLLMTEFAYNNAKNASISHNSFKLNCGYHSWILYKEDIDPRFQSKSVDKLSTELKKLIIVCQKNLYHTRELQKYAHNKGVKPRSSAFNKKV